MNLKEQILNDIKEAMKQKDDFKRDTLRTLNAAFKQVEVDERIELSDERILKLSQARLKSAKMLSSFILKVEERIWHKKNKKK